MSGPSTIPSRQLPGLVALLAAGGFVTALSWFKLGDVDGGYHLAYGRVFLQAGKIVGVDPFLNPGIARPFVNANWGSQVIMACAERAAGASGLVALRSALLLIVFACIAAIAYRQTRGRLWIAWAWLLAGVGGYERFSMRPELFSYAAMMILMVILATGVSSWPKIACIGLLQLAWVNLHSYFLVGVLLTSCWWAGEALSAILRRRRLGPEREIDSRTASTAGWLGATVAIQIGACFVNPWGISGAAFPLKTLEFLRREAVMAGGSEPASASAWSEISEFHSPFAYVGVRINRRTIEAYWVMLAVATAGTIALAARGQFGAALAVVLLAAMSTQMRRNVAQFALAAAPLCVSALATMGLWQHVGERMRRGGRWMTTSAAIGLAGWWTLGLASGRFYYDERRINREWGADFSERTYPREATQWLAGQAALKPGFFVDYFSSSNVLPWLPDRFKLFVDTNTFAYEDSALRAAFDLGLGRIDHNQFFNENGVNVVMLHGGPDTQPLVQRMMRDSSTWALVYFDRQRVVFLRRIMEHQPIIQANAVGEKDMDAGAWIAASDGAACYRAQELATIVSVPISLGWWRPAIEILTEAVHIAPDFDDAWQMLGACHGNLAKAAGRERRYGDARREFEAAADCFAKALELNPGREDAAAYLHDTRAALKVIPQ